MSTRHEKTINLQEMEVIEFNLNGTYAILTIARSVRWRGPEKHRGSDGTTYEGYATKDYHA